MKPMIKYRGGKSKEISNYIHHITNEQFDTYFEPFIGGGATFFYLEPEKAVINDINSKLINFYGDVRDRYPLLKSQLYEIEQIYKDNYKKYEELKALSPDKKVLNLNEELYYKLRQKFNYPDEEFLESTLYYFINKTAYSGMIRYNKNGEFNVPFGRYKNFNTDLINQNHHELLKRTDIYNTDYSNIFKLANPKDIMFLDPPYDCVFNDYGNLELADGFNEEEHRRLANDFKNLNTRALMVISKTRLTEELYKDYIVDEYYKNYSVNIRNRFKNEAIHLVIKNY
ncbi:DNA adenine methylase [Turicibacter sanguinis]|uniref:DNA adenine methylase n=1 Tax=Turicibacter sanguinis TaxID=154288 RepID=UPI0018AC64C0|nr:Dam family site-specific DNA-(adenine-N6)-methyltransferase [Turicibacter sanguinis]MDB8545245.1 Dam family site-specific DNA-(adenine-N6)-methyltransferase [Turicibacter sanguinis]